MCASLHLVTEFDLNALNFFLNNVHFFHRAHSCCSQLCGTVVNTEIPTITIISMFWKSVDGCDNDFNVCSSFDLTDCGHVFVCICGCVFVGMMKKWKRMSHCKYFLCFVALNSSLFDNFAFKLMHQVTARVLLIYWPGCSCFQNLTCLLNNA